MQEAQKKREEQELIEAAAQRRRDKIEAERERERLKAQIKADREEREFRERLGKQMNMQASAGDMPAHHSSSVPKMEPVPSDRCRVQVRLPDGDNIVDEFDSNEPLTTLVELIKQDGRVSGHFQIAQVYPRKVFSEEELRQSFLSLCLTPNCTLLVLQYVYGLITGWLGWGSGSGSSTTSNSKQTSEAKRHREPHETGATVRRRGNVTRLHNTNDDSDDDNANWNGNSTQFL
ncbi:UBX domain protein [Oesophagostomum dentatum]|uniref:UBX domain-containing protein 4 n=1 Tax=Oesophagostomum dentatum TaxID=61180 RepID=A0A0B1SSE7_OESDE|nr:UBX domain protein [Oesophagostomum dentatum]